MTHQPPIQHRPLTPEEAERLARAIAEAAASLRAFAEALAPAVQAATAHFRAAYERLQAAGLIDEHGQPTQSTDRPAWQTPYGPPRRDHQR